MVRRGQGLRQKQDGVSEVDGISEKLKDLSVKFHGFLGDGAKLNT